MQNSLVEERQHTNLEYHSLIVSRHWKKIAWIVEIRQYSFEVSQAQYTVTSSTRTVQFFWVSCGHCFFLRVWVFHWVFGTIQVLTTLLPNRHLNWLHKFVYTRWFYSINFLLISWVFWANFWINLFPTEQNSICRPIKCFHPNTSCHIPFSILHCGGFDISERTIANCGPRIYFCAI